MHVYKIAFANAHARAISLLEIRKLSMSQVFDENANFGLPTGSKIRAQENLPKIISKFILLNELFNKEIVINYDCNAIKFMQRFPKGGILKFFRSHTYELYATYDREEKYAKD